MIHLVAISTAPSTSAAAILHWVAFMSEPACPTQPMGMQRTLSCSFGGRSVPTGLRIENAAWSVPA